MVKVVDTLGRGVFGTVYKVQRGDEFYALKREKILTRDIKKIPRAVKISRILRKHPLGRKYFIDILDYRISKCDYKQPDTFLNRANLELKKQLEELAQSPYCLETLMELGGCELRSYMDNDIIHAEPLHDKYTIVAQLIESVKTARECNIFIDDLHNGNILLNVHPIFIKHIDYGGFKTLAELKSIRDRDSKKIMLFAWNAFTDLFAVIILCFRSSYVFNKYLSKLKKFPPVQELVRFVKATEEWDQVLVKLKVIFRYAGGTAFLDEEPDNLRNNVGDFIGFVFALINKNKMEQYWQQFVTEFQYPPEFIPHQELLFIIDNYWDIDLLIRHFYELSDHG